MARPDLKILSPFQNALTTSDGKYNDTLRALTNLEDSDTREATAKTLIQMLELEVKEAQDRIHQLKMQRWRREQSEPVAPAPKEPEVPKPPPGTPPAPEHRESIWTDGKLPPIVTEDFRRLAGLEHARSRR